MWRVEYLYARNDFYDVVTKYLTTIKRYVFVITILTQKKKKHYVYDYDKKYFRRKICSTYTISYINLKF